MLCDVELGWEEGEEGEEGEGGRREREKGEGEREIPEGIFLQTIFVRDFPVGGGKEREKEEGEVVSGYATTILHIDDDVKVVME